MDQEIDIKQFVIRYGLLFGLIGIIIGLLGYLGGMDILVSMWFGITVLLITIGLQVFVGIKIRKSNGGYISFGKAFTGLLGVYAISALLGTLFNVLLFNVIDPELPVQMKEAVMESTVERMEKWNVPEETIEQTLIGMETMDDNYRPEKQLLSYVYMLIFGAILSLIIAAFIKKKRPEIVELNE